MATTDAADSAGTKATGTAADRRAPTGGAEARGVLEWRSVLAYTLLGVFFGVVLIKSEVASWFRIQEMFRFQSFHMYGVLGSALTVAGVGTWLLRRFGLRSATREEIHLPPKRMGRGFRYAVGGTAFGMGWALTGACPGPLFALAGSGVGVMTLAIASALAGTWTYGVLRSRLPHY